jgi:hypothetical protein
MKIGLVGATYQQLSLPFDAQRSINLFPIMDQTGKEVASMYGTPGLYSFASISNAPMRGMLLAGNGRAFAVSGSQLFEVSSNGDGTLRGSLNFSTGTVYMVENGVQLAICDGINLYIFTYATNVFKQIIGGQEYVTNGNFTSSSGWTLGSGWSISGGQAVASSSSAAISQTAAITIVSGVTYTLTYTVSSFSAGTITPSIGGTAGIARSANGTYTETIVAGSTQAIAFTGASSFTGDITAISINDPAFGLPASVGTLTFLDDFFLVSANGTRQFFKSAANDGTSWNALDFASKESSPDNLLCVKAAIGQLWLLGAKTTEIWTNTGAALFPFQKISGGQMTQGIYAPATAIELDNTIIWVGGNIEGQGVVYRATGFIPRAISTGPIDIMIRNATDGANMRAYAYQEDGHVFYVLTGGGLATSLVYDITTDMWHERAYLNDQGEYEQHLGCCFMQAFGKHLVGDRTTGNIYVMDTNTYTDDGQTLSRERIYTHLSDEAKRVRYNSLVIGVESGVGLQSGQGSQPLIELQLSVNGARTWSDSYFEPIGAVGAYRNKAEFRRLGVTEQMTFKIRITDPVKCSITGSYLN